nr:protein THEMIS2-like [Nerophis lumbriciformis]
MSFPLQEYIASLDSACLPKILQVCSGVYFQGSVYEISGNEVSFSTGDIIKVTGMELSSICCEDVSNNETFELPVDHTGLMKVIPEETPYSTVEELVKLRPVSLDSCFPVTFTSNTKLTLDNVTLGAGATLTVLSVLENEDRCRCHVRPGPGQSSAEVNVPLGTRGEFYIHGSEESFTPREIATSPHLRSQRFRFENATMCKRTFILSPIYQISAIMNLRKNVLQFPSSLEMDVIDISDTCEDTSFVTPLSLLEVHSQPEQTFPVVVEVLEDPEMNTMFKCSWLSQLHRGTMLIFHQKSTSSMTVISSLKSRKPQQYFLVSKQYAGRFRRRPRGFDSVYELYVASTQTPGLKVSVVRNSEEVEEEGLPGLTVGERLEVIGCRKVQLPCGHVEVVVCQHLQDMDDDRDDDDDQDGEENNEDLIYLPLYMQGQFVELLSDNKKYTLEDLSQKTLLDVKAVTRDPELEKDPLLGFTCLRIEGTTLEPTIQASFLDMPDRCFEIPVQRLGLTVCCTQQPLPWSPNQPPKCSVDRVTEVTDRFLHEFQKEAAPITDPPPRPPKRIPSVPVVSKSVPTKEFNNIKMQNRRSSSPLPATTNVSHQPPPPPRKLPVIQVSEKRSTPNTYVGLKGPVRKEVSESDDAEYEQVDEMLLEMLKNAQETVSYY